MGNIGGNLRIIMGRLNGFVGQHAVVIGMDGVMNNAWMKWGCLIQPVQNFTCTSLVIKTSVTG